MFLKQIISLVVIFFVSDLLFGDEISSSGILRVNSLHDISIYKKSTGEYIRWNESKDPEQKERIVKLKSGLYQMRSEVSLFNGNCETYWTKDIRIKAGESYVVNGPSNAMYDLFFTLPHETDDTNIYRIVLCGADMANSGVKYLAKVDFTEKKTDIAQMKFFRCNIGKFDLLLFRKRDTDGPENLGTILKGVIDVSSKQKSSIEKPYTIKWRAIHCE